MMFRDFDFCVEGDRIRVRFVSRRTLGKLGSGHQAYGDYSDKVIRLPRWETRAANRTTFWHELGHYLCERVEWGRDANEEDVCDLLSWVDTVLGDPRNGALRDFLGL